MIDSFEFWPLVIEIYPSTLLRVVSPLTLLMTVSLSNGLPNHLEFVFCYLKLFITETLIFLPHVARIKSDKGLVAAQILQICRNHPCQLRYSV